MGTLFIKSFHNHLSVILFTALVLLFLVLMALLAFKILRQKKQLGFYTTINRDENLLSRSNLLYTLIDNLHDSIYIKDKESRFIVANKKVAIVAGKQSGEELSGLTDYDIFPRKMADAYRKDEINIILSGVPIIGRKERSLDESGKNIYLSTNKFPLRNENGDIIGIVGIGRDITKELEIETELEKRNEDLKELNTQLEERQEEILQQQEEMKVQNEKIQEERNHLMTLINSMPDRIYIKDRESKFIIGNATVAKVIGAESTDQLIGKTDYDFHPKEMAEEYFKDEQEIMLSGKSLINKEEQGLDENGNKIIKSVTKIPVKDEKGNVIGIVGIGRDISKQKETEKLLIEQSRNLQEINTILEERKEEMHQQAEELKATSEHLHQLNKELEKLSLVASKTDNVIVIMDRDANIEWVNDGFIRKHNMSLDEFRIQKGSNLREISYNKNIDKIIEKLLKEKTAIDYQSERTENGKSLYWSQTTISPVLDDKGNIIRLIAIDADITKLKEAELQIQKQKEEMELNRDELKKLNTTKDKFFSIIAHDLKNPFHAIMGFSELLARNYDDLEDEKKLEFIKLINESSKSTYELLENLLNWARTQSDAIKFNPQYINVAEIIYQNVQITGVAIKNKKISLELPESETELKAFADSNMMNTIFRNLLSNAIKFTPEGGKVSVSHHKTEDFLVLSIKDTGIGISESDQLKLFKLEQFHTTFGTSGEKGTGLGLIISKEFALKMGGDIRVESLVGNGSTFILSLPLQERVK